MGFVANFIRFPAVQKIWTSVKIWQSYRQLQGGNLFLRQCRWGARGHHLVSMIEPSVCGGDAALCQATLTTCSTLIQLDHLNVIMHHWRLYKVLASDSHCKGATPLHSAGRWWIKKTRGRIFPDLCQYFVFPSVLWQFQLGDRKGIRFVKNLYNLPTMVFIQKG